MDLHSHNFLASALSALSLCFAWPSLVSTSHRYECSSAAGPMNPSSPFHHYSGHAVLQHAHRMHSYEPSSSARSAGLWRYSDR